MDVRVGLWRKLRRIDAFELWCWRRSLRISWTSRRSNQSILKKSFLNIHWKGWCWSSNTLATWCEELTGEKRPWWWVRLNAGGEGNDRGWDGYMASSTRWTWVSAISGCWLWPGKPDLLHSVGLQRVRHDWVTEVNWATWEALHPQECTFNVHPPFNGVLGTVFYFTIFSIQSSTQSKLCELH